MNAETQVPTPCVKVCKLDPDTGYCLGCFRTREEVANWLTMTDDEKRAVWASFEARQEEMLRSLRGEA
ncbi:DUF1289 domain-containing protein [bacterium]|nr:DUF1289 domain-containing protein [bacterium]